MVIIMIRCVTIAQAALLRGFLRAVANGYQQNPFHNFAHACLSALHFLYRNPFENTFCCNESL